MIEELKASIELAKKGNKIVLELMNAEILQRGITIMRLFLEYPEEGGVLTIEERRDTQLAVDIRVLSVLLESREFPASVVVSIASARDSLEDARTQLLRAAASELGGKS
jgi:hypothetical protein